jgi:hypothetical protein
MTNELDETEDDDNQFYIISEAALKHLPLKWREEIEDVAADGRTILKSVDQELSQLSRLSFASIELVSLRYFVQRLSEFEFKPTVEAMLEHEMLTLAFVVTYSRLHKGGVGSGFDKGKLPKNLRKVHDAIMELRNKRFAHNAGHHSIRDAMRIGFEGGCFEVEPNYNISFQVGGAPEWKLLVEFIDELIAERIDKVIAKLVAKTGRDWTLAKGPIP